MGMFEITPLILWLWYPWKFLYEESW
jgi:hypothetical protein